MKLTFLFPNKDYSFKKKMTIFGIWFIALVLPLFTLKFMFLGKILIPHTLHPYEDETYFFVLLIISSGLIRKSNMMRRTVLLILYLSMFFLLVEYIEESMRITESHLCIGIFKGYGVDYNSLIYPQKILKFMTLLFLIPFIHIILIYILSNEESFRLYKTSQLIHWKETLSLLLLSIGITIFFIISLINPLPTPTTKLYPQNFKKITPPLTPPKNPFITNTYESLNLPTKPYVMYKLRFDENSTENNIK